MDEKAKLETLVGMGFTVDEALALVKGNYRTVPDNKDPEPAKDPETANDPEQAKDQEPENKAPEMSFNDLKKSIDESIEKLRDELIKNNINNDTQPKKESVGDLLGRMLEPTAPESEGNYGSK